MGCASLYTLASVNASTTKPTGTDGDADVISKQIIILSDSTLIGGRSGDNFSFPASSFFPEPSS